MCNRLFSTWSDLELVNNKTGLESLGIDLFLGVRYDHFGDLFPIPQTMAGVEIDMDSDELQEWYHSFTRFLLATIFEAQHKSSEILNKYFEDSNRANRQEQSYFYATKRWRDIKIALIIKLAGEITSPNTAP
jgi:hypothetical protein